MLSYTVVSDFGFTLGDSAPKAQLSEDYELMNNINHPLTTDTISVRISNLDFSSSAIMHLNSICCGKKRLVVDRPSWFHGLRWTTTTEQPYAIPRNIRPVNYS